MNRKIKKILSFLPPCFLDFYEMLFDSAAENHLRFMHSNRRKFRSYTQLKRHQKKVRMAVAIVLLIIFSVTLGVFLGPVFYPQPPESELYIPNGKGDILLSNVSKNQVTVIFKTLDSANGNRPLATKASVEFFDDPNFARLIRRANDDYAVTHIIPVDSLQDGVTYYIRVSATDSATPAHSKTVTTWGGSNEQIKVFTAGDLAAVTNCAKNVPAQNQVSLQEIKENAEKIQDPVSESKEVTTIPDDVQDALQQQNKSLQVTDVRNESYLQPGGKVQTIISWSTNLPASTVLIYGEDKSNEKTEVAANDQMLTRHQAVLTTLKTGTTYYFKVKSIDKSGSTVISEEYSLRTPRPQETVIQKIGDSFKAIFKGIKPN